MGDGLSDFVTCPRDGAAAQCSQACGEFFTALLQVLRQEEQYLRPVVGGVAGPATARMRGLNGVADVLAVAEPGLPERLAVGAEHRIAVAAVGTGLFAAALELGGAVKLRRVASRSRCGGHR